MATMTLHTFQKIIEDTLASLPEEFDYNLIGGYHIEPGEKIEEDYYILGEYIEEPYLGSFIVFYYGSFKAVLAGAPYAEWEREIKDTVWHELQHHLESLAGREDLARQEELERHHARQKAKQRESARPAGVDYRPQMVMGLLTLILLLWLILR